LIIGYENLRRLCGGTYQGNSRQRHQGIYLPQGHADAGNKLRRPGKKAGGTIIITASHNPAIWNGFKYKDEYGSSASDTYSSPRY